MIDLAKISPPQFIPILIPRIAKAMDWEDADEIGEEFKAVAAATGMLPPALAGGPAGVPPGAPPGAPPPAPPGGGPPGAAMPPPGARPLPPQIAAILSHVSPRGAPAAAGRVGPRPLPPPGGHGAGPAGAMGAMQ
jgi:hypothetical protein